LNKSGCNTEGKYGVELEKSPYKIYEDHIESYKRYTSEFENYLGRMALLEAYYNGLPWHTKLRLNILHYLRKFRNIMKKTKFID
jgi:hypothetical protein